MPSPHPWPEHLRSQGLAFEPAAWAGGSPLRRIAPCGVYALDLEPTETCPSLLHWVLDEPWQDVGFWAQNPDPERAELSAKELCSALRALGLRRWPRFLLRSPLARLLCRQPGHLVAVCFGVSTDPRVHPRTDYHMFRLDRNGWWSHKLRDREPQDVDFGERRISDPRKADRGEYPIWLGYWWCPHPQARLADHARTALSQGRHRRRLG